jgi:peptidyl-prolyl cis-trans isomerase B (cyclophilin B)
MKTFSIAALAASMMVLACIDHVLSMPAMAMQDSPGAVAPAQDDKPAETPAVSPAQDQPVQPPAEPDADTLAKDREMERLIQAFGNLLTIAQNTLGGLGDAEMIAVERLRADLEMFNLRWPDDQRMIALELQCSRWLGDRDRVDQLFGQLVEMNPGTPGMLIVWAEDLYGRNEYARVLEVLELSKHSLKEVSQLAFLKARSLFAEHRFEEAAEALALLPESPQLKGPHLLQLATLRRAMPEYVKLWEEEQTKRAAEASADDLPLVTLETEHGTIKLELYENEAPIAVANFITLAESGFYDNTTFHRVVANHVTQGGDPNTKPGAAGAIGEGGPGYTIADEHSKPEARAHFSGSLGMAHSAAPNSAGSQFYICHEPKPDLNGSYTIFGRVVEGLDIARHMKLGDKLVKVAVERKRPHEYEFEKLTGQMPPVELRPVDPSTFSNTKPAEEEPAAEEPSADEPEAEEPAAAPEQE